MLQRIAHFEIVTRDVDAMAELYKRLGFEEVRRIEHHGRAVELQLHGDDQVMFEFHTGRDDENPGLNHIAFLVDNLEATVAELKSKGVEFESSPRYIPSSGRTTCNFRYPGGFRLQLIS